MFNEVKNDSICENFSGKLYKVVQADEVFGLTEYAEKISELRALELVNAEVFNEFYWHLLANFFNYMQFVPDPRERNAPLFNVALARAKMAFKHVAKYKDTRFQYAYISLAVFFDLGVCLSDYEVVIADDDGEPLDLWHPFVRGLSDYTNYLYKIRPYNFKDKKIRLLSNAVLACKIIPESGLVFLREDPMLFGQWLRALLGQDDIGDLAAALDAIKAFPKTNMTYQGLSNILVSDNYADVEAFWAWLLNKLEEGKNCEIRKGAVKFEIDSLAKEYIGIKGGSVDDLKAKLQKLNVVKSYAAKSGNFATGCSMFDVAPKKTNNCMIVKSVKLNSGKYYKSQSSAEDSKNKLRVSLKNIENQNQQMT